MDVHDAHYLCAAGRASEGGVEAVEGGSVARWLSWQHSGTACCSRPGLAGTSYWLWDTFKKKRYIGREGEGGRNRAGERKNGIEEE